MQTILVVLLFAGAIFYLGRMLYRSFKPVKAGGCEGDCKCDAKPRL